jgi:hypothetical protein
MSLVAEPWYGPILVETIQPANLTSDWFLLSYACFAVLKTDQLCWVHTVRTQPLTTP